MRKSWGLLTRSKRPLASSGLCKLLPKSPETFNSAAPEWKLPAEVAGARGANVQGAGSCSRPGSLGAWGGPGRASKGCGGEGAGFALLWVGLKHRGCSGTAA